MFKRNFIFIVKIFATFLILLSKQVICKFAHVSVFLMRDRGGVKL